VVVVVAVIYQITRFEFKSDQWNMYYGLSVLLLTNYYYYRLSCYGKEEDNNNKKKVKSEWLLHHHIVHGAITPLPTAPTTNTGIGL